MSSGVVLDLSGLSTRPQVQHLPEVRAFQGSLDKVPCVMLPTCTLRKQTMTHLTHTLVKQACGSRIWCVLSNTVVRTVKAGLVLQMRKLAVGYVTKP